MRDDNFTSQDRMIYGRLKIRQTHILDRLAQLIKDKPDAPVQSVSVPDFLGAGYAKADIDRISAELSAMKGVIDEFSFIDGELVFHIPFGARHLFKILVRQAREYEPEGNGALYCEAALALKRAFKAACEDVWFEVSFITETFNHGEDVSYLDSAFQGGGWMLTIPIPCEQDAKREIRFIPDDGDESVLHVVHHVYFRDRSASGGILTTDTGVMLNPEKRAKIVPEIVNKANELFEDKL